MKRSKNITAWWNEAMINLKPLGDLQHKSKHKNKKNSIVIITI